jgi:hypothetical protein
MVTAGVLPFRENSHGRAGNRTRDLMISSQKLWSLDHEAGRILHDKFVYVYLQIFPHPTLFMTYPWISGIYVYVYEYFKPVTCFMALMYFVFKYLWLLCRRISVHLRGRTRSIVLCWWTPHFMIFICCRSKGTKHEACSGTMTRISVGW